MPMYIPSPFDHFFYTKNEIDLFIDEIDIIKANKIIPDQENNIALLNGLDGDLVDSGVQLEDLVLGDLVVDGGTF